MTTAAPPARVPAGTPSGGRFATATRVENDVELAPTIPGYTPGVGHTTVVPTSRVAAAIGADLDGLPANVTSFDIETDTSGGFGLDPAGGQITELVLANRDEVVILAGDERHILQGLADYLNARPAGEVLASWNGAGFDNGFLATRGAMHAEHLTGWGMAVHPITEETGSHYVCAGYDFPLTMTWARADSGEHHDVDLMRVLKTSPLRRRSLRLKDNARRWGAEPIELDRATLHERTAAEREDYVASDGVCGLLAYRVLTAPEAA